MAHDFKNFPELTNSQMQLYYFDSPHKQIIENFSARVVKVHDGDTVTLRWTERDFDFPLRFINISAAELKDENGYEIPAGQRSKSWLEGILLNKDVDIIIKGSNRVDKWGRLLGIVICNGMDVGEESINAGQAVPWSLRADGQMEDFGKELIKQWS